MTDVTLRWLSRRLIFTVLAASAGVSLLVAVITVAIVQSQANTVLRREQVHADTALRVAQRENARLSRTNAIGGCDGVNLIRGDARLLTHRGMPTKPDDRNLTDWLLRLRDCPATYEQGRIVIVPGDVEFAYLKRLAARHRVAIRHDARGWHLLPMA
jgi:hypothetical protein